jgi:hypothetical protein
MFIIKSSNAKGGRWISGIFRMMSDAEAELHSIPDDNSTHVIVQIELDTFPFFIAENDEFSFGDVEFVLSKIRALKPIGEEQTVHMTVFAVTETFKPIKPGRDEMGRFKHWHIDDECLVEPNASDLNRDITHAASQRVSGA